MPAIRFKRSAIIGGAALGSLGLMGVAWMALKPQVFRQVSQDSDFSAPVERPASDALDGLPVDYGDAPKLGPPLPGDLGRPILRVQERGAIGEQDIASPGIDKAEAERQRLLAELKAARESGLMVQVASARDVPQATIVGAPPPVRLETAAPSAVSATHKEQFVSTRNADGDVNTGELVGPASPNTLFAGSVIAASLNTGLNSDLPGMVTAQVTQNVYDTVTGRVLLAPQGARLMGKYDSVVAFGQSRGLVIWQRLILPNGSSVRLDNMPATDAAGFVGLADKVDFHTWKLLKGVSIATLLGVGSELTISGESDLVEAIRVSTQSNATRAGDQITQRNLDIQPTITVRPGTPVRVLVTRDLILSPWRGEGT